MGLYVVLHEDPFSGLARAYAAVAESETVVAQERRFLRFIEQHAPVASCYTFNLAETGFVAIEAGKFMSALRCFLTYSLVDPESHTGSTGGEHEGFSPGSCQVDMQRVHTA